MNVISTNSRKYRGDEHEGYHENKGAITSLLPWSHSVDHFVGQAACRFIEMHDTDKPFAMMVGFPGPHCPYDPAEDFDFKEGGNKFLQSQPVFQNEEMKGDVMQLWRNVVVGQKKRRGRVHTYSDGQRALIETQFDETTFLLKNADFIGRALDIGKVQIHVAGDGEDVAGKAKTSMPLEPGVAWR